MGINKDSQSSFLIHLLTLLLVAAACAALLVVLYHCMIVRLFNRNTAAASSNNNISHRRRTPFTRGQEQTPSTVFENSLDELIPAHKYHRKGPPPGTLVGGGEGGGGEEDEDDSTCAVCLCEFEDGEELRTMPECVHSFHVACIDMWLFSHSTCPVCRKDATPSPSPQYMLRPFLDSGLEGSATTRPPNDVVPNLVVHLGSVMMV